MENPILETEFNGQPFAISGDEQAVRELADTWNRQARQERLHAMGRAVLMAPVTVTRYAGRALATKMSTIAMNIEIDQYDHKHGTNFRELINEQKRKESDKQMAARIGKHLFDNPDLFVKH